MLRTVTFPTQQQGRGAVGVPVIVLTNGRRECISQTIPSITRHLRGWSGIHIVNDSPDPHYAAWLDTNFPPGTGGIAQIHHRHGDHGYWHAMREVFALARATGADAVAFWEDDFVLQTDVDLTDLAEVLTTRPYLVQIALLRQPWFPNEIRAGGLIEALEEQGQTFHEVTDGTHWWIEHRAVFTGNPTLLPRSTFTHQWPAGAWSESRFGRHLFTNPQAHGAYWGRRSDPPRVQHIGHRRLGSDY